MLAGGMRLALRLAGGMRLWQVGCGCVGLARMVIMMSDLICWAGPGAARASESGCATVRARVPVPH